MNYTKIQLDKRNGKKRIIYIPDDELKRLLKSFLLELKHLYQRYVIYDIDHAFMGERNSITHAQQHLTHPYVLSLDIQDFFDSIYEKHFNFLSLSSEILQYAFANGHLVQGFPTSPYLANIAMIPIDKMLVEKLKKLDESLVYSRYADDLTFSFSNKETAYKVIILVTEILNQFGLKLNQKKIKLYDKQHGRAIITGVGVDYTQVYPTRKTLKKIRAAKHQGNDCSWQGLTEWSLCKVPKIKVKKAVNVDNGLFFSRKGNNHIDYSLWESYFRH